MSTHTFAIVTGASRGLGEALALEFIQRDIPLITVARSQNPGLQTRADARNVALTQLQSDLALPESAQDTANKIAGLMPSGIRQCILINNAGTVEPIANTADLTRAQPISQALTLNVTALMLMCASVLRATQDLDAECRILNISSGAGRNPMPGWGVYCATKAAVDLYTRVLSQEHPSVRAVSLAPGVIDTDMQQRIRSSDAHDFPNVERFQALHRQGQLSSPVNAAHHIIDYLQRDDFGTTVLDDIRHYS